MAIAQMIGIENVNPAEMKERIKAYFSQKDQKWLLIFDNADDMDMWMEDSSTNPVLKDFSLITTKVTSSSLRAIEN